MKTHHYLIAGGAVLLALYFIKRKPNTEGVTTGSTAGEGGPANANADPAWWNYAGSWKA